MRKIVLPIVAFIILSVVAHYVCVEKEGRSFHLVLKETLSTTAWERYEDSDFHYVIYYPSFFAKEDAIGNGVGYSLFGYHANDMNMSIECKVSPVNEGGYNKENVVYARQVENVSGYTRRTHSIKQGKLWYTLSFYYPDTYKDSVQRLLYMVDNWNVWGNECKPDYRMLRERKNLTS